jgi:hypothetical protein
MSPRGGTEIQLEFLHKNVDKSLLDNFQICTSVPDKIPIDPNKINILWQKNSYDQSNLVDWFKDKSNHKNMIGMYLIVIGTMNSLDSFMISLLKNVLL